MNLNIISSDGNKVAQLNTENINSNYSSSMEEAFAILGYTSDNVVAEAEYGFQMGTYEQIINTLNNIE